MKINKRWKILGLKEAPRLEVKYLAGLLVVLLLTGSMCNDWIIENKFANADIMDKRGKVVVLNQVMQRNVELHGELAAKDDRIEELDKRFQELMDNPITFKQTYFLEKELFPLSRKYGIPDALIAGQWAIESGRAVHKSGHNYFGLMQWDAQRNRSLQTCPSLDECVKRYASTVKSILSRKGYTYNPEENPVEILRKLQEATPRYEGDSSKPDHYVELVAGTKEFKTYER